MSYNNYVDADAALRAAYDHAEPAVAIIKHANPCGIAVGADIAEAHRKAHACDPVSAFGGVIATNRPVTAAMAAQVAEVFTEVVVAPAFEPEALEILTRKKNIRLLRLPERHGAHRRPGRVPADQRRGAGADPRQDRRRGRRRAGDDPSRWTLVAGDAADEATLADLAFAWRAIRAVKSNAILLADDGASVGVGMGQVNRVDSCRLAVSRAGEERAARRRRGLRRVLPVRRRPAGAARRRRARRRRSPAARSATTRWSRPPQAAGVTMYFTGTRHFAH